MLPNSKLTGSLKYLFVLLSSPPLFPLLLILSCLTLHSLIFFHTFSAPSLLSFPQSSLPFPSCSLLFTCPALPSPTLPPIILSPLCLSLTPLICSINFCFLSLPLQFICLHLFIFLFFYSISLEGLRISDTIKTNYQKKSLRENILCHFSHLWVIFRSYMKCV